MPDMDTPDEPAMDEYGLISVWRTIANRTDGRPVLTMDREALRDLFAAVDERDLHQRLRYAEALLIADRTLGTDAHRYPDGAGHCMECGSGNRAADRTWLNDRAAIDRLLAAEPAL